MFEAKLAQASTFRKLIDAIKELITEASWDCSETALSLQAMDTSHVALCSAKLEAEGFEEYRCDRHLSLGTSLVNMSKVLKCAGADDSLTLRAQDDANSLTFFFESEKQDRTSEFEIRLMDIDVEHLGIPEQEFGCIVKMPAAEFARICRDMTMFGDSLTITCTKSGVQFQAKGDFGSGNVRVSSSADIDTEDATEIDLREPVTVNYALKYLNFFCKAAPLAKRVHLSLANEVPIVVEFPIEELGFIRYYLAPKIEDEEATR